MMDFNKYKREYHYKGTEGGKLLKWLIILVALAVAVLAYFTK